MKSEDHQRYFVLKVITHVYDARESHTPTPTPQSVQWATPCWHQPSLGHRIRQFLVAASNHTGAWGNYLTPFSLTSATGTAFLFLVNGCPNLVLCHPIAASGSPTLSARGLYYYVCSSTAALATLPVLGRPRVKLWGVGIQINGAPYTFFFGGVAEGTPPSTQSSTLLPLLKT